MNKKYNCLQPYNDLKHDDDNINNNMLIIVLMMCSLFGAPWITLVSPVSNITGTHSMTKSLYIWKESTTSMNFLVVSGVIKGLKSRELSFKGTAASVEIVPFSAVTSTPVFFYSVRISPQIALRWVGLSAILN